MHFAGIDIPAALIAAHANDQVVFFVGAGASMAPPTNLPNFADLTKNIARVTHAALPTEDELKEPDVFLGQLDSNPMIDVHRLVERQIKGRTRNQLHTALARVASAQHELRIVTTNYDNHLFNAAKALGIKAVVHEAPALPDGSDFEGIVHIHGRLGQPARRLVVTDSDFGTAYITRGWAPTFLREMFAKYVVCFVGYSHEDRMMEYLAKGLPSDSRERYIFTDANAKGRWERLRITPIIYPQGKHSDVHKALDSWATWARDTPYNHAGRIRLLAGATPPVAPDDHDFLAAALSDSTLVAEVCKIADGSEWVNWMIQTDSFRALTEDSKILEPGVRFRIADWAASRATSAEHFETLHSTITSSAKPVAIELQSAIARNLVFETVDTHQRSTWLRWLISETETGSKLTGDLELLWASEQALSWPDTLILLDHLATRWTRPRGSYLGISAIRLETDYHLALGANRLTNPRTSEETLEFLNWISAFFENAHRRLVQRPHGFDSWSFRRRSIAASTEGSLDSDEPEDFLINIARDSLQAARTSAQPWSTSIRVLWMNSPAPLLRRLALNDFNFEIDAAKSADDYYSNLFNASLLNDQDLIPELYAFLAQVAPKLSEVLFQDLLAQIINREPVTYAVAIEMEQAKTSHDRKTFNLLHWIRRYRPEANMPAALLQIEALHPEWLVDDSPNYRYHMTGGSRSLEDDWPWQPDELHKMIGDDPALAVQQIVQHAPRDGDLTWWGAGDLVRETIATWPEDGFLLWHDASQDTRGRIVSGWTTARLDVDHLEQVAALLLAASLKGIESSVATLLRPWSDDPAVANRWIDLANGRLLARRVALTLETEFESVDETDLYSYAINSTTGTLAEYWIAVAAHEARHGTYPGGGLSNEIRNGLEELLSPSGNEDLARASTLRQLNFFVNVDPRWAKEHLLALLDPSFNPWAKSGRLWGVVLDGQVSDALLAAGLSDWILEILPHIPDSSPTAMKVARVAAITAVHSSLEEAERIEWITAFTSKASQTIATGWVREVAQLTLQLSPEARTSVWRRWMHTHLTGRASGVPRTLTAEEGTAFIDWLNILSDPADLKDGMARIAATNLGLRLDENYFGNALIDEESLRRWPDIWASFMVHLLKNTQSIPAGRLRWLSRMFESLRTAGASDEKLDSLKPELFRLGAHLQ